MIVAVFCFHFALNDPRVIVRVGLASLGVILLAKAVAEIIKKRKSAHSDSITQAGGEAGEAGAGEAEG
jgi:hypothetical protein